MRNQQELTFEMLWNERLYIGHIVWFGCLFSVWINIFVVDLVVSGESWHQTLSPYRVYVLFILLFTYFFNQLDCYMLAITIKPMAQKIHFGDLSCMVNTSFSDSESEGVKCNGTNAMRWVTHNVSILMVFSFKIHSTCWTIRHAYFKSWWNLKWVFRLTTQVYFY